MSREEAIKKLSEELKNMIIDLLDKNLRSCLNCVHRSDNELNNGCVLFNTMPPPKIIAKGCSEWKYDEIPF